MSFYPKICFLLLIILIGGVESNSYSQSPVSVSIVPAPLSLSRDPGSFTFSASTVIRADTKQLQAVAFLRNYLLENWGYKNAVGTSRNVPASSFLEITEETNVSRA